MSKAQLFGRRKFDVGAERHSPVLRHLAALLGFSNAVTKVQELAKISHPRKGPASGQTYEYTIHTVHT